MAWIWREEAGPCEDGCSLYRWLETESWRKPRKAGVFLSLYFFLFIFLYATVGIAAFSPPRGCPQLGELQVSHAAGSAGKGGTVGCTLSSLLHPVLTLGDNRVCFSANVSVRLRLFILIYLSRSVWFISLHRCW